MADFTVDFDIARVDACSLERAHDRWRDGRRELLVGAREDIENLGLDPAELRSDVESLVRAQQRDEPVGVETPSPRPCARDDRGLPHRGIGDLVFEQGLNPIGFEYRNANLG